ncbi:MAG: MBL fold metallo-hydrolase [Phycisphaerales bacterium]|nr:MBL fold metallo-hydrolase [Phycisphaerales bacterium]
MDAHPPLNPTARLCILGSGSRGNCSVLHVTCPRGDGSFAESVCLIDLGFSPRSTAHLLESVGLSLDRVTAVLLTHLDTDHCHTGWNLFCPLADDPLLRSPLPRSACLFMHESHLERAYARGVNGGRIQRFAATRTAPGPAFTACSAAGEAHAVTVHPLMSFHDDLGSAAFRIHVGGGCWPDGPVLGFATDLGRITDELVAHFSHDPLRDAPGIDVLVIESNYCPKMQLASDRPDFLKRRVMGGRGHLSNDEALDAIEAIAPRSHVVLVHLSGQCNDPALVASLHRRRRGTACMGPDCLTISAQDAPTPWVPIRRPPSRAAPGPAPVIRPLERSGRQLSLFG